jgi:hypothetical protein
LNGPQGVQGWQGTAGTTFNPISGPYYADVPLEYLVDANGVAQTVENSDFGISDSPLNIFISGYQTISGQQYLGAIFTVYTWTDTYNQYINVTGRGVAGSGANASATVRVYYYVLS